MGWGRATPAVWVGYGEPGASSSGEGRPGDGRDGGRAILPPKLLSLPGKHRRAPSGNLIPFISDRCGAPPGPGSGCDGIHCPRHRRSPASPVGRRIALGGVREKPRGGLPLRDAGMEIFPRFGGGQGPAPRIPPPATSVRCGKLQQAAPSGAPAWAGKVPNRLLLRYGTLLHWTHEEIIFCRPGVTPAATAGPDGVGG